MEVYQRHVFVCTSTTCGEGDPFTLRLLIHQRLKEKLGDEYQKKIKLTKSLCLAQCGLGPNIVVYPEGIWYKGVKNRDINEIVDQHLVGGQPVERLMLHKNAEPQGEITKPMA